MFPEREGGPPSSELLVVVLEQLLHTINGFQEFLERRDTGVSSLTIEDMQKGPPKITSKAYAGDPLTYTQVDGVLDVHGYAHREAERRSLDGWAETVAELQASR